MADNGGRRDNSRFGQAVTVRGVTARLTVNPLVGLVWVGGAVTALGGLLALRRRPRQRPSPPPVAAPVTAATPVEAGAP